MILEKLLTPPLGNASDSESLRNPVTRKNIALLGAFCFFLSTIEYMIPKPMPFMRIGIANLPLMLALDIFPFQSFLVLVAIKVLGQALLTGTLFSYIFLFSIAGTSLAAVSMYALRRLLGSGRISFIGVGAAGAMMSNISQLSLAWFFIFKNNVRYIATPFLVSGLITGIVLGIFCELFIRRSTWYTARRIR
jgi:heptaprenyl diphosphate synthase